MPASRIAAVSLGLRSQFLDGLTPTDRKTIVAAATSRRFFANSVITNQGHLADDLFLLTRGLVRYFFVTEEGKKLLFQWLGAGDLFGGRAILSTTFLLSRQHRSGDGQFSVDMGSPDNPRPHRTVSQVAGERVVDCIRLRGLASHVSRRFSLLHKSAASCSKCSLLLPALSARKPRVASHSISQTRIWLTPRTSRLSP